MFILCSVTISLGGSLAGGSLGDRHSIQIISLILQDFSINRIGMQRVPLAKFRRIGIIADDLFRWIDISNS